MATKTVKTGNTTFTITYTVTETATTYKVNTTKVVAKYSAGTWSQKYYVDIDISDGTGTTSSIFSDGVLPKGEKTKTWTVNRTFTIIKDVSADEWCYDVTTYKSDYSILFDKYSSSTTVPALAKYTLTVNWLTVTNGVAKYQANKYTMYHGRAMTFNARPAYNSDGLALTGYVSTNTSGTGSPTYATRPNNFSIAVTSNLTLYEVAKHTVTYNGNGSTSGSTASNAVFFPAAHTVAANGFQKTGYTFSHWSSKADNTGGTYNPGGSLPTNNFDVFPTLYAIWKRTVTYNANAPSGVSGLPAAQSSVINTAIKLSTAVPIRSGYTFLGWATSSGGSTSGTYYVPGATYPANYPNQTLYAIWGPALTEVSATRTDSSGNPDVLGGSVTVAFTVSSQTSYTVSMGSLTSTVTESTSGSKTVRLDGNLSTVNPEIAYTVIVTAQNSGGSVSKAIALPKSDYKRPTISSVLSTRVNANRLDDDEGTYARLTVNWAIHPTNSQRSPVDFHIGAEGADGSTISVTQPTVTGTASPSSGSVFYIPLISGGYVYSPTADTEVNLAKTYYSYNSSTDTYSVANLQYYTYTLTSDTTVNTAKTYYSYGSSSATYTSVALDQYTYTPTSDTVVASGKTYYVLSNDEYMAVASPVAADLPLYFERTTNSPSGYYERSITNPSGNYYERSQTAGPFDVDTSYTFTVTLTDKMGVLGTSYIAVRSDVLSNAYFTMDVLGDAFRYQPANGEYDSTKRYYVKAYRYEETKDEVVDSGKTYYTRAGSGTEQDPYVYTQVVSPSSTWISTYYEQFDDGYNLVENSSASDIGLYYEASGPMPGHGVAFGMPALQEGFDVRMPATFHSHDPDEPTLVTVTRDSVGQDSGFRAENKERGIGVRFIVGSGGENHGIWSDTLRKWLIYASADTTKTYLHGGEAYFQTVSGYSGALVLGNGTNQPAIISYRGPKRIGPMIKFVPNNVDDYGDMLLIGGGGPTVIGSGESAYNLPGAIGLTATSNEAMYITSDASIQFLTNCNTIADKKNSYISSAGTFVGRQAMNRISNNIADARNATSATTAITGLYDYDGSGSRQVGYSEIMRTSDGVYRSFAVTNPKTGQTNAIYLWSDDAAGSFDHRRYTFTSPAAFRSGLGLGTLATKSTVSTSAGVTNSPGSGTNGSVIAAGATATVTASVPAVSGYTLCGVQQIAKTGTGVGNLVLMSFNVSGSGPFTVTVGYRNVGSAQVAKGALTMSVTLKFVRATSSVS